MKTILTLLITVALLLASTPSARAGAYHTLFLANPPAAPQITVPANKVLTIVNFLQSGGMAQFTYLNITANNVSVYYYATTQIGNSPSDTGMHGPEGIMVAGPATISFVVDPSSKALFTYKLQAN